MARTPRVSETEQETAKHEQAMSLMTLGAILAGMAAVLAIIWWVVVLSPIGFGRAFEHTIGGGDMKTKVSVVFIVAISLCIAGGIGSACYGLWKYWRAPS